MYVLGYSVFKLALCLLIFEVPIYVTCKFHCQSITLTSWVTFCDFTTGRFEH